MNEHESTPRRVLYLIVCGTGYAATIHEFVEQAKIRGWDTCVVLTPMATRFVDVERLTQQTGHPVRSEYKRPEETDVLPRADVLMVYGATFNTINKWRHGISDNLALGLLCEYTGLKKPILAVPVVRQGGGLDAHPAFPRSIRLLRHYGIHVFYQPEHYPPRNEVPGEVLLEELEKIDAYEVQNM